MLSAAAAWQLRSSSTSSSCLLEAFTTYLPTTCCLFCGCRDSHIKQIYAAMRCFMTDVWQHSGGECAASSITDLQFQLDDVTASGHQYRTAPRCLHLLGGSGARICLVHSPKGDMFFGDNPQVRSFPAVAAGGGGDSGAAAAPMHSATTISLSMLSATHALAVSALLEQGLLLLAKLFCIAVWPPPPAAAGQ